MTQPPSSDAAMDDSASHELALVQLRRTRPARFYFAFIFAIASFAIVALGLWLAQSRNVISGIVNTVTQASIPASVEKLELSKTLEIIRAEGDRALFGDDFSVRNEAYFTLTQLMQRKDVTEDARALALVQAAVTLVDDKHHITRGELSGQWSILNTAINRYSKEISATSFKSVAAELDTIQDVLKEDRSRFILVMLLIAIWHCILLFFIYSLFVKPLKFIENQIRHIEDEKWSKNGFNSRLRELQSLHLIIQRLRTSTADNKVMQMAIRADMLKTQKEADIKADFLNNMSHEIKTPLSTITGMIHLIEKSDLNDKQRRYAQLMARSCTHLNDLVTRILDISRIEANKLHLEHLPFELQTLLEEVVDIVQPAIIKKQLKLNVTIDSQVPHTWVGDKLRIKEIFINFLSNATKHTSIGSITTDIQVIEQLEDTVRLRIAVSDTGNGLSQEDFGLLFHKFSQGSRGQLGGSGLGLFITKKLAELMQGTVGATTMQGAGATFWAEIVVNTLDAVADDAPHAVTRLAHATPPSACLDADALAILKEIAWYAHENRAMATHTWIKHEAQLARQLGEASTPIGDCMRAFKLQEACALLVKCLPTTQAQAMRAPDHAPHKPAILIIDDTPSNIDLLSLLLDDVAHMLVATDPDRGIQILRDTPAIALLILDITMPHKNGFDVLRELKTNHLLRDTKVVMISASESDVNKNRAIVEGAIAFIDRGQHPDKIHSTIEAILANHF